MLNGVHKPDAANNEARPLECRHAAPRPTSAASSARPRRCRRPRNVFIRLAQVPRVAGSSATQDTKRGTSVPCSLDPNARAAPVYSTWTATILFSPPIVLDATRESFFSRTHLTKKSG
ncbi:hypothetical protein C8R45DRAFT_1110556 [Mycena sanguinolenta]|nr:hypothetical protein C8R45DRAFT_1110556 [Mycena sanguinolenta]